VPSGGGRVTGANDATDAGSKEPKCETRQGPPTSGGLLTNRQVPAPHTHLELETIMGLLAEQRSRMETSTTGRELGVRTVSASNSENRAEREAVVGEDGLGRCPWAVTHPANLHYHDTEWGMVVRGEQALFERISLEAFQAGLSWLTILTKRPAFRAAFDGFDPEIVAGYTDEDFERLMNDETIIRNRAKIEAARSNARAVLDLRQDGGLDALIWSHKPEETPVPRTVSEVPTSTPASKALAEDLRSRGFRFVGPTTAHALMEAIGMVDTHLIGCHRRGSSGQYP
jgi:DNA-3-methyladenine glycosylase I